MVITEEELRQAWQNGRGRIPDFPPGTRFTPAALDFLKARSALPQAAPPVPDTAPRTELRAPAGQRLIVTAEDLSGLPAGPGSTLVVHPSVTVTHVALDHLRKAGVRVVPWVEPAAPQAPPVPEADLFHRAREAVLARLDRPVDPELLDEVLRRVLAYL
jgi:hypothetical protein